MLLDRARILVFEKVVYVQTRLSIILSLRYWNQEKVETLNFERWFWDYSSCKFCIWLNSSWLIQLFSMNLLDTECTLLTVQSGNQRAFHCLFCLGLRARLMKFWLKYVLVSPLELIDFSCSFKRNISGQSKIFNKIKSKIILSRNKRIILHKIIHMYFKLHVKAHLKGYKSFLRLVKWTASIGKC